MKPTNWKLLKVLPMDPANELSCLLKEEQMLVAMLAPSFPVEFEYPTIISQLKELGFDKVVEVALGAAETNRQLLKLVKANPKKKFITAPCPSLVRLVRSKYPHLEKYLAPVESPMIQTARIVKKKFPEAKLVFIGPCPVKRLEANEDYPEREILVLTYKEIKKIFQERNVKGDPQATLGFDLSSSATRLYPISGGLAQSCGINRLLTDEEYDVVSGPELCQKVLTSFEKSRLKVLDILFCKEGCIMGKGIDNDLSVKERRERVITHWSKGEF